MDKGGGWMQCCFLCGPHQGTRSQNGLKQRQAKLTQGKNERKWTQSKNGGKQQSGALIGVRGKRPAIEVIFRSRGEWIQGLGSVHALHLIERAILQILGFVNEFYAVG
jgi:hypothetical protein